MTKYKVGDPIRDLPVGTKFYDDILGYVEILNNKMFKATELEYNHYIMGIKLDKDNIATLKIPYGYQSPLWKVLNGEKL